MGKKILLLLGCGLIGLALGYAVFGKWGGEYVSFRTLFSFGGNGIQSAWRSLSGLDALRDRILLCGAAGLIVGAILSLKRK